ncbi:hypothetical protein [Archangium gephyra]|uniref:Lipoprotein n=1 Tax=Archangium gephyra TaxID=48 RepID=A0AAC8TC44_9BACT|nr:hypothetical protein [Archangium gephyra]AKJ00495.1 putative lipoprotein [Archangium gephyra]
MAPQEAGTLQLPLTSTSGGKVYRLVGAAFHITGPQTVTVTDTAADTVQTTLEAGAYTIELASGWRMERADAPGTAVPAALLSPNPLTFTVKKDELSQVRFMFKLPGDGTADVGIHVDSGGWFAGTIRVDSLEGDSGPTNPYSGMLGKSVPFLISFESFTASHDSGPVTLVHTSPITVQFAGVPSEQLERVAAALNGSMLSFKLRRFSSGSVDFNGGVVENLAADVRLELSFGSDPFVGLMDAEGYPVFRPFETELHLRLRDGSVGFSGMTDVNAAP